MLNQSWPSDVFYYHTLMLNINCAFIFFLRVNPGRQAQKCCRNGKDLCNHWGDFLWYKGPFRGSDLSKATGQGSGRARTPRCVSCLIVSGSLSCVCAEGLVTGGGVPQHVLGRCRGLLNALIPMAQESQDYLTNLSGAQEKNQ